MRPLATLIVIALAGTLLSGCVPAETAPPDDPLTVEELADGGIEIVEDELSVPASPTALTITAGQAEWLTGEANLGAGFVGAELDALAPVDTGIPPTSYLIASWVTTSDLPGASVASTLFPEDTDFTRAPELVFPAAALALFVADMMAAATEDSFEPDPSAFAPGASLTSLGRPLALEGACSAVSDFFSSTVNGIFGVLRVLPGVISGIKALGFFGSVLAGILNGAISLAQGAVEGLISSVVGPALAALRNVITVLGVATMVVSYFTKERLVVTTAPSSNLPFGILPAEGVPGTFTAQPKSLTRDWPALLVDCAKALKAELPELVKAGTDAQWKITQRPDLISLKSTTSVVSSDKTTKVDFVTGTEDEETAKGPAVFDASRVSVAVPGKQVADFVDLVVKQLDQVKANILAPIPTALHGAVRAVFAKTIDKVIASVRGTVESAGGILSLKGDGVVYVTHHRPKEPTPKPTATSAPNDGAFCEQFRERVDAAAVDLATAADPFSWAGRFATALDTISAQPPAAIAGDFQVVLGFYRIAGQTTIENTQPLADYVTANDSDNARVRLWAACEAQQFIVE